MPEIRVYLDNCVYNRPFDDQRNILTRLETEAKLIIQQMIKDNEITLIWSDVIGYENNDNPFDERREKIGEWEMHAAGKVMMSDAVIEKAREYMIVGLRQKDAAHIACAVFGKSDYFITVDRKIINKPVKDITVIDPIDFLRRLQNDA
jgi:predicted nucleic acid-binding protein